MPDNANVETRRKRIKDFIPSNARWFLADLLGIDKTFTEEDLTSNELDFLKDNMKDIVKYSSTKRRSENRFQFLPGGRYYREQSPMTTENLIDLIKQSYNPEGSLQTSLGRSTLEITPEMEAVIKDKYNFELEPKAYEGMSFRKLLQNTGGTPYDVVSWIAGNYGSKGKSGEGNPININLGKLEDLGIDINELLGQPIIPSEHY